MPAHAVHWNRKVGAIAGISQRLVVTTGDAGGSAGVPGEWDGEWAAVGDCAGEGGIIEMCLFKKFFVDFLHFKYL
jgi:hypothetical protein